MAPDDRRDAGPTPEQQEEEPLLASYRGRPDLDRQLRQNLRTLRDSCEDASLRARFDDVLAGRSRLRDLALSPDYQRFMGPLVLDGARRWEEAGRPMEDEVLPERPAAPGPTPPAPPAAPTQGTW